jgi:two-component system NarL family sensor kinase
MNEIVISIIAFTLMILLLVAGIVITFFIAGRNRIKQQIELAESRLTFERELRAAETEVTETVMTRVAQELHDNLGQMLTALHIQVQNQKLDYPQLSGSFKTTEDYIAEIHSQLRLLSRTLNNDFLGHLGIMDAIKMEIDRVSLLRKFEIDFVSVPGDTHLVKNQELMLFRIFQEIIQNALRHSGAKAVKIIADNSGEGFSLEISDNGIGFDKEDVLRSTSASGLRNIIKRAKLAGLELTISSSPGKGSLFIIKKVSTLQ